MLFSSIIFLLLLYSLDPKAGVVKTTISIVANLYGIYLPSTEILRELRKDRNLPGHGEVCLEEERSLSLSW